MKRVMIDIGACNGRTCKKYLDDNFKVYAFEPLHHNVNQIEHHDNLTVVRAAAGSYNGTTYLFLGPKNVHQNCYWGTSIYQDKTNVTDTPSIEVSIVKLSDYWRDNIYWPVHLLRMNCEGAEYDILEDLMNAGIVNRFKRIQFQDHTLDIPSLEGRSREVYQRLLEEYSGKIQFINSDNKATEDVPEYLR